MTATLEYLNSPRVCDLAGVTYRQLDYWVRVGYLRPTVAARGSGSARRFTRDDVLDILIVKALLGSQATDAIGEAQVRARDGRAFLWVQGDIVGTGDLFDLADALEHVGTTVIVNLSVLRALAQAI